LLIRGEPIYSALPGTSLSYVANTADDIFRDDDTRQIYVLVGGRWFTSPSLTNARVVEFLRPLGNAGTSRRRRERRELQRLHRQLRKPVVEAPPWAGRFGGGGFADRGFGGFRRPPVTACRDCLSSAPRQREAVALHSLRLDTREAKS